MPLVGFHSRSSGMVSGGKHYLANRIVGLMPKHINYVEPYAGGLSVMLAKNSEGISEVANDLNGWLSSFWKVISDPNLFHNFKRIIDGTPFSEALFRLSLEKVSTPCEGIGDKYSAVTFFIACRQSMAGRMNEFAPLSRNRVRRGMNEQASAWLTAIEGLPAIHDRLKRVVVLNRPAIEVIKTQDGSNTLQYLDPPYLASTRTAGNEYGKFEMSESDHLVMLTTILSCESKFMVSGYDSELYNDLLKGWRKETFDLPNNAASGKSKKRMTECLWMNY